MSDDNLLELARTIAERASGREAEAWRDIFRRFAAMTPAEREMFLWHLDVQFNRKKQADDKDEA
jgi:hypothetical protein